MTQPIASADAAATPVPPAIRRAAEEFETVFLSAMLKPLFSDAGGKGLLDGGPAQDVYRSMLRDEYAAILSQSGGVGVADMVQREMLKMQEGA